jgi:hypothetical protein
MPEEEFGPVERIHNYEEGTKGGRQAKMIEEHSGKFPDGYEFDYDLKDNCLTMSARRSVCRAATQASVSATS